MATLSVGYLFDEELESAISVFVAQTKMDAKVRRDLSHLTYDDVYWASKIENPLVNKLYASSCYVPLSYFLVCSIVCLSMDCPSMPVADVYSSYSKNQQI